MPFARSLSLAAIAALAGCGKPHREPASAHAALPPVAAQVHVVQVEQVPLAIEVTGTVQARQRAQVAAKLMGAIEEMPVALGQRVRAGDVLVKLAAGEISARVAQARTQLSTARRDLERERALLAKGASTNETVRNLEDRVTTTEAQVREAETLLGYALLRAPFDGVVTRKLANAGDLANPGTPLLELDGLGAFEIQAGVPETLAAKLAVGAQVPVEIPATGLTFSGRLAELSSAADADARSVAVKIAVPADAAVRSGQFARVKIPGEPRPAVWVPESAVTLFGQMERVFLVGPDRRAVLRLVKTGAHRGGRVEILSGLAAGDRVVVAPPHGLQEGQPVETRS